MSLAQSQVRTTRSLTPALVMIKACLVKKKTWLRKWLPATSEAIPEDQDSNCLGSKTLYLDAA